jgi:DNA ligase-1
MLAQPGEDLSAAVTATSENGSTRLEHKLDGARIQVHRLDDEIRVYTRELHDISDRVPEIVQVARALRSTQFVLDGEALALKADGRPYPFQDTMRRIGRKKADESVRAKLPLSPFFFDVLHVEGKDLLDESLAVRRAELENFVPAHALVEQTSVQDEAEARAFLERALSQGHEGVMAKDPGSTYEAGRRGGAWLKIKPAHTLDLVVLAAEWGSGRRKGFLSNIHLGARGPGGTFVMLGKTFKGMTDAMLAFQTEQFQKLSLGQEGSVVHVRPELVVEVAFDGIQKSVQYPGGLALRFARVKRYRTEKNASQADTIETVRALYQANH